MKILVAELLAREGLEILGRHHEVDEKIGLAPEEYRAILPGYDALVVRSQVKVDAEMIAAGTRLVVIGRAGVGVDNVDLDAATRAGITVVNAPTGNTIAAAELTLALLFALTRKVAAADASVRRGEWKRSAFAGHELRGKTLGVVGIGKIGQAIADRARALEMTVIGSDPFVSVEQAAGHGIELVPFEELLERSDAVTLHVPVTKTTRGGRGSSARRRANSSSWRCCGSLSRSTCSTIWSLICWLMAEPRGPLGEGPISTFAFAFSKSRIRYRECAGPRLRRRAAKPNVVHLS